MNALLRFWPKTIGGQLAGLLVGALLIAQLVSLLILSGERGLAIDSAVRAGAVERLAAMIEVMDDTPPRVRVQLAGTLDTRSTRIWVAGRGVLADHPMSSAEQEFSALLSEQLGVESAGRKPIVRLEENEDGSAGKGMQVTVSFPMREGGWLDLHSAVRPRNQWHSWPWLITLAASAIATLAVAGLAVRRVTRPMTALAAAAGRIGRGDTGPVPVPPGPLEIRATIEAFNAMQERLYRYVKDRTRMVAALSHDLRTPITSLRLRVEFVEDDELRADMLRTLDDMQAMADATLAFSREEGLSEETRAIDLAALVEGLVDDQKALGRAVDYHGPDKLVWPCRPFAVKRAVANLVENAVRYGGSATVTVLRRDGAASVEVIDDGPGIPPDRLADVFEPFVRLEHSRNRETGGTGLGLSIARSIARAHGGDLSLINRETGGLKAVIDLP